MNKSVSNFSFIVLPQSTDKNIHSMFSHLNSSNRGGFEEAVIRDQIKVRVSSVLVEDLKSANLYRAGGHLFLCRHCSVHCFVTGWHIHSQAGWEMNADTVQHGSFGVWRFLLTFFSLSFISLFLLLQAWVDTTRSTHMTQRYNIYRSGLYREEDMLR